MCEYCEICCVCIEKERNHYGLANLISHSAVFRLYEVVGDCKVDGCPCYSDGDAMCLDCKNWLCKHHWDEAVKSQPIINEHAIKQCQACTLEHMSILNKIAKQSK